MLSSLNKVLNKNNKTFLLYGFINQSSPAGLSPPGSSPCGSSLFSGSSLVSGSSLLSGSSLVSGSSSFFSPSSLFSFEASSLGLSST